MYSSFRFSSLINRRFINQLKSDISSVPPTPSNFNKGFFIHKGSEKMELEIINAHLKDKDISFDEKKHEYLINGKPAKSSVTEIISRCFPKFDEDEVIRKMMEGTKWPRPEYTFKDGKVYTADQIKKKWENNSEYARNKGTWMHYNIERYMNKLVYKTNSYKNI